MMETPMEQQAEWFNSIINTIQCGDCLDFMKNIDGGVVDLVLTDPPYGIKRNKLSMGKGGGVAKQVDYGNYDWDNNVPKKEVFDEMKRISTNQIIFGGNYFDLSPSPCWIVWDKKNGATDFADCELAWTSFKSAVRMVQWRWSGMLQEDMKNKDVRVHPTQKPLGMIKWIIEKYSNEGDLICDPFIGSGTTAVACKELNRDFIGFEINQEYVDIANKRLSQETLKKWEG